MADCIRCGKSVTRFRPEWGDLDRPVCEPCWDVDYAAGTLSFDPAKATFLVRGRPIEGPHARHWEALWFDAPGKCSRCLREADATVSVRDHDGYRELCESCWFQVAPTRRRTHRTGWIVKRS